MTLEPHHATLAQSHGRGPHNSCRFDADNMFAPTGKGELMALVGQNNYGDANRSTIASSNAGFAVLYPESGAGSADTANSRQSAANLDLYIRIKASRAEEEARMKQNK